MRGGLRRKQETCAVLDIGTSKIACLIGQKEADLGVRVIGSGIARSEGIKAGAVADMELVEYAIRQAVSKAEKMAGTAVQAVSVNVASRSVRSEHMNVHTEFASGEVADRDLNRVINSSLSELAQPEHAILHAIPLNWSVDGEDNIDDPRGMFGSQLGVDMHFVVSGVGPLRNLAHCVERCHLQIKSATVSPYAAGLAVLTEDEMDLGATVIDLGGGTTSAAIFRDNTLIHVDNISIGARTLTADIARVLVTPGEAAERIKLIYGSALHGADDERMMIPCPPMGAQDSTHHEPRSLLTNIIRHRIEETFERLRDRLRADGFEDYAGRRIVLTGGGAQLNGIREVAEYVFNKRVRIGQPHGVLGLDDTMSGPGFAVASGLLKQQFMELDEAIKGPPDISGRRYRTRRYGGGGFGRTWRWLKENF